MEHKLWVVVGLWLACHATAFTTDPKGCRVCSWRLTCKQLCESAGPECRTPWKEGPDDTMCRIIYTHPTPDARTLQGRMVHSEVAYLVHKDVLSDLLHRYSQVKRIRLHGGSLGMPGFGELDALALQHSISLAFPRSSLAWRWLTGQHLAPSSTVCCHQECHWEEMFKRTQMPTLQELFAKAVEANEAALSKHAACGMPNTAAGTHMEGARVMSAGPLWHGAAAHAAAAHSASSGQDATAAPQAAPGEDGAAEQQEAVAGAQAVQGMGVGENQADVGDMVGMAGDVYAASTWYGIGHEHMVMRVQAREHVQAQHAMGGISHEGHAGEGQPTERSHDHQQEGAQQQQQQHHHHYGYPRDATGQQRRAANGLMAMLQSRMDMTLEGLLMGLAWLLVPGLLIAYDAMAIAATSPWMAVYMCVVATLRTMAEWWAAWLAASGRYGYMRERVLATLLGTVIMALGVVMVTGVVTALLPVLPSPLSTVLLWGYMLATPFSTACCLYGVWSAQVRVGTSIGAAPWVLFAGGSSGGHRTHGTGHNHRQRGSHGHGGATRHGTTAQASPVQPTRPPTDAVAVVRMLNREAVPMGHAGAFMASYNRAMQQAVEGAGGGAARAMGQQAAAGGAAGGVQMAAPPVPNTPLAAGVGTLQVGQGATPGRSRTAGNRAPAAAGGVAATAGTPAGGAGMTPEQAASARQSAAAAALAAIHWPPALDVPAWMEEECVVPDAFRCPITLSIMREPTQASSGVTYERSAIFQWLHIHRVDPVTHVPLKRHRLTPNLNLRHMIEDWASKRAAERAVCKAAAGDVAVREAPPVAGGMASTGVAAVSGTAAQTSA